MSQYKYTEIDETLINKIENKRLTKPELKKIELTLQEDFPEYWKWRSKYNSFGMIAIILGIIEVILVLILFGIIPVVDITPGNDTAQRLVFGLIIVFVLFFFTNVVTAFFAFKYQPHSHAKQLVKLMKLNYPQELVDFDIPGAMGLDMSKKKRKTKV